MAARPLVPLLLALTLPLSLAAAQGLGDAAARERARREKQVAGADRAGKSFSNDDLERGRPPDSVTTASSPAPSQPATPPQYSQGETVSAAAPEAPATPTPPAKPESEIPALEARIKLLQDKLNPMSGSYIFGPFGSGDPTEEPRTRDELQQLEAELAKAREAAARASVPMRQEESEPAPH